MQSPHIGLKGVPHYAIALIVLAMCAYAFRTDLAQIEFAPIWAARDAVLIAALLSLANYALRAARWSMYLARLGHPLPAGFSALTYLAGFAFTLSPGKVGEMARGYYCRKIGIPLSVSAAVFFIERLMDLLAMLALALIAAATLSDYDAPILLTLGVIASLLPALALVPWTRISEWIEGAGHAPAALKEAAQGIVRTLRTAKALLHPRLLIGGFVVGLVAWGAEGLGLLAISAIAPAISMDWAGAIGIYSVAIVVGALSFLPGGLGSTEAVMIALLAEHGSPMPDAILLTFVCRLATLWLAVAIGWFALTALRRHPMLKGVS